MVTVIEDKDELITPVSNGVPNHSNDMERPSYYIKDYQEVDFHRSPSCKPLPESLSRTNQNENTKSSIEGTFFVQADAIESGIQFNTHNHSEEQTNNDSSLLLTLTDGCITVRGLTIDQIPDLNLHTKPGCKLLLTGVISIKDGLLQLTNDNTRFQHGSNTYPRPRSAYRGRGGGSHRPSYEGRRGGNNNPRHANEDNESNFVKRPPPKTTLMDFMPSWKNSNETKATNDNENQKVKERSENKRRNPPEQHHKANNGIHAANSNYYFQNNNHAEQITFQQDGLYGPVDPEDDPSHANYRERRNPLPPRLQRAQEERTRRNTIRYYDETMLLTSGEVDATYRNGTANNHSLSSSSSFSRLADQSVYMSNGQQHPSTLSFVPHGNILATVNGSTQPHLAYFQTNSGPVPYNLAAIPSPPFPNQPPSLASSYSTSDPLAYCYAASYVAPAYLPVTVSNGFTDDSKTYANQPDSQTKSFVDEHEPKPATNESQQTEKTTTNETDNKSQSLAIEQKAASSSLASSSSASTASSNDGNHTSQQANTEQNEEKRREAHPNSRPRWRVGDMCLARWSEDREFYAATILQIQPPYCTVIFRDYNTYDQVHFGELKIIPSDQQCYQMVPPLPGPQSDLNPLAANAYFPPRTTYYPTTIDGCVIMPEAPPFPFNSDGTFCICPQTLSSMSRSTRYHPQDYFSIPQLHRRQENGTSNTDTTVNSTSPPSKDSNDTSMIDSTTVSVDDNQQKDVTSTTADQLRLCSIADAPLKLVTTDEDRERSTSTESMSSSRYDEQQSINEEDKSDRNSVINDS
ncbi:unnamed protein product [Adineta ricciae]|uniref:Tudor domain-containing protein n=1 Tax=Adineta ricciae TaxID=249248 RepID=A0A815V8A1_ADIRI|nr:unnamed protein product [Adineta ricciae]